MGELLPFYKNVSLITLFQYIHSLYVVMKEARHLFSCIQNLTKIIEKQLRNKFFCCHGQRLPYNIYN